MDMFVKYIFMTLLDCPLSANYVQTLTVSFADALHAFCHHRYCVSTSVDTFVLKWYVCVRWAVCIMFRFCMHFLFDLCGFLSPYVIDVLFMYMNI